MLSTLNELTIVRNVQDGIEHLKSFLRDNLSSLNNQSNNILAMNSSSKSTSNNLTDFFSQSTSFASKVNGSSSSSSSPSSIGNLVPSKFFVENKKELLSILKSLVGLSVSATVTYFLFKWLMKQMDPTNSDKLAAKTRADHIMKEIGLKNLDLNEYELVIASNLIMPKNIDCSWEDIGGLEHIIDDLRETVIYPLKSGLLHGDDNKQQSLAASNKTSMRSRLIKPPSGVLFFGPPGNAKTMIAKALAKESGARFINLQITSLYDKWFGETQKRTEAIFSLAAKIQPVIIFIDEIDTFLRSRSNGDHECTSTMKTQFMTLWDGLTTGQSGRNRILIIGATNRPEDVDSAILRRMPQMFYIGLPNLAQRIKILTVILKGEQLSADVCLDTIAEKTNSFSGSDLHELCRCAAMNSFIENVKSVRSNGLDTPNDEHNTPVVIRKRDFEVALEKMAVKSSMAKLTCMDKYRNQFD